jgi:hypothetical protein
LILECGPMSRICASVPLDSSSSNPKASRVRHLMPSSASGAEL